MKHLVLTFICIFFSASLFAQSVKAEDLEKLCTASSEAERTSCLLIVKVYMDGFIEGVGKGATDTYKYDPQISALVKDVKMKDMAPRVNKVIELATCIQRVSVKDMADTYVEFVRRNPSIRDKHYREAMTRSILTSYCQS
ncbi:hypothetical protein [Methylomonas fluvii]|uniref:Rap1a immunity protein domain-containing protein n=1 Tax=Methylomonas fluvii TaxID=1854564 RepID=A0ABR9D7W9_9GAMM|nr:hypothetical protein [Methylomonas fluvii]MBD9359050.1 hypothetical protein [Methylomonas fluvii]